MERALRYLREKGRVRWEEIPALRKDFHDLLKWIDQGGTTIYVSDLYWDARLLENKKEYVAYSPDLGEFAIIRRGGDA